MRRLHFVLLSVLVGSSLWLVSVAYDSRRLFNELERARAEHQRLEVQHKRLDAERQAQATHLRVDRTAREKLAMRPATAAVTVYVEAP
jgi:cell division protein FtsL